MEVKSEFVKPNDDEKDKADPANADLPWTAEDCTARMLEVNQYIKDVSARFSFFNYNRGKHI